MDAIAVLETLDLLPSFQVWLVGGDAREQSFLRAVPVGHLQLRGLASCGRWVPWGAVENTSLPELYSRSTVVVIPSIFEQFGLVALEAMACGCPVVASDVGGLRDTVVPGVTGELFAADDAEALANILAGYLRNPCRREYHGVNARLWALRFSTEKVYSAYYEVVCNGGTPGLPECPRKEWRRQIIEGSMPECEEMLKQTIVKWEDFSGGSQTSARLITEDGSQYHAKFLRPRPATLSLILPIPLKLQGPRSAAELVAKYKYFSRSGLAPALRASSLDSGIVITEWLPEVRIDEDAWPSVYSDLTRRFARWGSRSPEARALINDSTNALHDFASTQNDNTLAAVDRVSARLHAGMLGGALRFNRLHPQVEIFRLFNYLEKSVWSIPAAHRSRLQTVLGLLLQAKPIIVKPPYLQHGSLKPAHVLSKGRKNVACDLDNAIYAVGPLDAIYWHIADNRIEEVDLRDILSALEEFAPDKGDFFLGASWLFVYLAHRLLDALMRGKKAVYEGLLLSLMSSYEGMFSHCLIP